MSEEQWERREGTIEGDPNVWATVERWQTETGTEIRVGPSNQISDAEAVAVFRCPTVLEDETMHAVELYTLDLLAYAAEWAKEAQRRGRVVGQAEGRRQQQVMQSELDAADAIGQAAWDGMEVR